MVSSKEQLATAERIIQIARYTIDRVRDSGGCPETPQEWNILLCTLENCIANEVNRSGTSPALREFGKSTFLLRNFLTDTSVTASSKPSHSYLKVAELAREQFRHVQCDQKFRDLLS